MGGTDSRRLKLIHIDIGSMRWISSRVAGWRQS